LAALKDFEGSVSEELLAVDGGGAFCLSLVQDVANVAVAEVVDFDSAEVLGGEGGAKREGQDVQKT